MDNQKTDLGLDREVNIKRKRIVNPGGSFNVKRLGLSFFDRFHLYRWLITASWKHYWISVFLFYTIVNLLFAAAYYFLCGNSIHNVPEQPPINRFLYCFFFSTQTFTTVGYGGMYPTTVFSNFLASIEAFLGLMTFALATGSLFGRFSRPRIKLKFSEHVLISPFKNGLALMCRLANLSADNLMEVEATVNISVTEIKNGEKKRIFYPLTLQINKISMFPSSWTLVHEIDEKSPLFEKNEQEIKETEFEIFILIKGFDEAFSQTIYYRHSYISEEMKYGVRFVSSFYIHPETGETILDINKIGAFE